MSESLLQTQIWADFKSRHGWRAHPVDEIQFLERLLPLGQRFLYAPELPFQPRRLKQLVENTHTLGKAQNVFAVRLEFLAEWTESGEQALRLAGLVKSFEEVQPEFRQWIDLRPTPDEILAQMKPKGRYNIRVAERHGVQVTESDDIDIFYALAITTAKRDGFTIRSRNYYADLLKTLRENNLGTLYVASLPANPTPITQHPTSRSHYQFLRWSELLSLWRISQHASRNNGALSAPLANHAGGQAPQLHHLRPPSSCTARKPTTYHPTHQQTCEQVCWHHQV